jgi:ankyrin repeat protein
MSFQISGFVQFFQDLFETAPPQPLAVPQRGATLQEIEDFVKSLKLPADLRNRLGGKLHGFASFFRARGVDPNDEGACTRFTKDYLDYFSRKPSPEFLNGRNAHGKTPLMCAIEEKDFDLVMDLGGHGAAIGCEVITFAIRNNAPDNFLKHLFRNADFDEDLPNFDNWDHPDLLSRRRLEWSDLLDSLCLLAERSGRLAVKCIKISALREELLVHEAASRGDAALIPILKDAHFDLDKFKPGWQVGTTPLMDAIMRRPPNRAVVQALLKAGASASAENAVGDSALTCARSYGHKDIALLLIRYGAPASEDIKNWISKDEDQQN